MLGLHPLLGWKTNLNNIAVIPLIIGMGIDYGIHVVHRHMVEKEIGAVFQYTGKAIVLSALTTMIGFGSLGLVGSFAGVASVGAILFLGISACFVAALLVFIVSPLVCAEEEAADILCRVEEKALTDTSIARNSMLIYPDAGSDEYRSYEVLTYSKGEDDAYMTFNSPRSIKGLSILSKGDDQWIFFPSTGRVRKIAGKSKDQSIQGVGGDFSYEDPSAGKWEEKYDFIITASNQEEWVLAGTPKKESSYSRVIMTIDKKKLMIIKIVYYKEGKGHFKDLLLDEIKALDGREVATRMTMVNYAENSKTVIVINDAKYDVEIDDKYFNPTRFYR